MVNNKRFAQQFVFSWGDEEDTSNREFLGGGAYGTIIVPSGSDLIGKTIQFLSVSPEDLYDPTDMLSEAISISDAGSYPLTSDQIAEVGGAMHVKLKTDSEVSGSAYCVLLWKS